MRQRPQSTAIARRGAAWSARKQGKVALGAAETRWKKRIFGDEDLLECVFGLL